MNHADLVARVYAKLEAHVPKTVRELRAERRELLTKTQRINRWGRWCVLAAVGYFLTAITVMYFIGPHPEAAASPLSMTPFGDALAVGAPAVLLGMAAMLLSDTADQFHRQADLLENPYWSASDIKTVAILVGKYPQLKDVVNRWLDVNINLRAKDIALLKEYQFVVESEQPRAALEAALKSATTTPVGANA